MSKEELPTEPGIHSNPIDIDGNIALSVCRTMIVGAKPASQEYVEAGCYFMKEIQPNLYEFAKEMFALRSTIGSGSEPQEDNRFGSTTKPLDSHEASFMDSYMIGALLMFLILQDQYELGGNLFPKISKNNTANYFDNLIDVELNHSEIAEIKGLRIPEDKSLSPGRLNYAIRNDTVTSSTLQRVTKTFVDNSDSTVSEFWDTQSSFQEALRQSGFFRNFGSIKGIVYGACDVFRCFELVEENEALDRWYGIETK